MTFAEAMAGLGVSDPPREWSENWQRVQEGYSPSALPVDRDRLLAEVGVVAGFSDDVAFELASALRHVKGSEALSRLVFLWYHLAILEGIGTGSWPVPFPLFPAVVVLSAFPNMFQLHRERGVPVEVTRGNCRDLEIWMRHAKRVTGRWGFRELDWLRNHCSGRLYRLGRLQFVYQPFRGGVNAYQNTRTGEVLALSAAGIRYTRDGLVDGTNGFFDEMVWTSKLASEIGLVRGHSIDRDGYATRVEIELDSSLWQEILTQGDPTLDVHIPEDGRLTYEEFMQSFKAAPVFYAEHFPELPAPKAFTCSSWLLDSQYKKILPEESNIVRFSSLFYLYPLRSDHNEPFRRVFGEMPTDLAMAPRDTALRRAMLDFTLAGGRLRSAGGFTPCV